MQSPVGPFFRSSPFSSLLFYDWWVHHDLGIPIRGVVNGSLEYLLASLQLAQPGEQKGSRGGVR